MSKLEYSTLRMFLLSAIYKKLSHLTKALEHAAIDGAHIEKQISLLTSLVELEAKTKATLQGDVLFRE